jgi:hypothetical protein
VVRCTEHSTLTDGRNKVARVFHGRVLIGVFGEAMDDDWSRKRLVVRVHGVVLTSASDKVVAHTVESKFRVSVSGLVAERYSKGNRDAAFGVMVYTKKARLTSARQSSFHLCDR